VEAQRVPLSFRQALCFTYCFSERVKKQFFVYVRLCGGRSALCRMLMRLVCNKRCRRRSCSRTAHWLTVLSRVGTWTTRPIQHFSPILC
jgi:hypothetical protein